MSFKKWLVRQRFKPNEIGGLGLYVHFNRDFPLNASWREYKDYLYDHAITNEVISVFERAWDEYWEQRWGEKYCRYLRLQNILKMLKRPVKAIRRYARRMTTKQTVYR